MALRLLGQRQLRWAGTALSAFLQSAECNSPNAGGAI